MTADGVRMRHPEKVWIDGHWAWVHSGRTIGLIGHNTEYAIGSGA